MTATTLDPITFEVLRHRLWMINDEQGRVAAQVSGSPAVYEAKDFNTSLLTPEGESLYVGIYTTRLSLCLNFAVKSVIARLKDDVGIEDGDAFVTNDPWAGAAHMNDILMVAPIFWQGRLVCWTGLAMHETDVGGPNPGSFTVGTPDVFGEAPLIPPMKMVERGKIRTDLENWVIRNSRTSRVNGLNLRARVAAINRTRERVRELLEEHGVDVFMEAQRRILELARESLSRRLRSLPDGTWTAEGFLDHDGNENRLYRIRLKMTKRDDRLKFDFRGTDGQARGSINATRVGLESGTVSAILPMLCYDMPWSPGGIMPLIEFFSEEGTINNARHPAGVSMATVSATFATSQIASQAIGKMLACSSLGPTEAQANWSPAWQGTTMAGRHEGGTPFTAVLLDQGGGGGGRAWRDGPDTGGLAGVPAMGIANVETYEKEYPVLYVYRRQAVDTGGPGLHRGGVGTELMIVPHRNEGPIDLTVLTHGASQPEGQGLYGGYPSSVQVRLHLKDTDLRAKFAERVVPMAAEEVGCRESGTLAAKQRTRINPTDAVVMTMAGGGGFGDPLLREPDRVLRDVEQGVCSEAVAREIYGVAFVSASNGGRAVDAATTEALRRDIRKSRLDEARRPARDAATRASPVRGRPAPIGQIGAALDVIAGDGGGLLACHCCGHVVGSAADDPKRGAAVREVPMERLSSWNRYGLVNEISVREYACPSCAHLFAVEVRKKDDPTLYDTELSPAPRATVSRQAAE
jgi:N-methylhydantoinase B